MYDVSWCVDCGKELVPEGAWCYDGALIACIDCHTIHQVSSDSESMSLDALRFPMIYP